MRPRVGTTLVSTGDVTTVVVIRWGTDDLDLTCGGTPMVDQADRDAARPAVLDPARAAGTQRGERYRDRDHRVEVLCTRAGWGSLAIDDTPLLPAGPLPRRCTGETADILHPHTEIPPNPPARERQGDPPFRRVDRHDPSRPSPGSRTGRAGGHV